MSTTKVPVPPRIAVIGGGIAGTLCSLILKNRGASPKIIDSGKYGIGGRLRGGGGLKNLLKNGKTTTTIANQINMGCQFIRCINPQLSNILLMLEKEKLISRWDKPSKNGRFGMLGSSKGGFLSSNIIGNSGVRGMVGSDGSISSSSSSSPGGTTLIEGSINDSGDFCNFVGNDGKIPTYVGIPSMTDLCTNICIIANIDVAFNKTVTSANIVTGKTESESGWKLSYDKNNDNDDNDDDDEIFDALVLATHNPSLPSSIVHTIASNEESAAANAVDAASKTSNDIKNNNSTSTSSMMISEKLYKLSNELQTIRDNGRLPLYSMSIIYPKEFSKLIPFDAVSVPGSSFIQFIVRESSKPGRQQQQQHNKGDDDDDGDDGELWTIVSTSQFINDTLLQYGFDESNINDEKSIASELLIVEMSRLLSPYTESNDPNDVPDPISIPKIKKWNAGFVSNITLSSLATAAAANNNNNDNNDSNNNNTFKEKSIILQPWRLGICGEYISNHSSAGDNNVMITPFEAAALSGLDIGERMSSLFIEQQQQPPQ